MQRRSRFYEVLAREALMGILVFQGERFAGSTEPSGIQWSDCIFINRLAREILEIPEADQDEAGNQVETADLSLNELFQVQRKNGLTRSFGADMLEQEGLYQDILMRKKNGTVMMANIGVKHIFGTESEEPLLLLMLQDVTVQKKLQREVQSKQEEIHRAYAELVQQNHQLKELDLAKDRFLALTTHELRTPLAAIVAIADVLNLGLTESEEQTAEFIRMIQDQATHLMDIVNDILDFAKIRAGKMEFYVEHTDVMPILTKIIAGFSQVAAQGQIELTLRSSSIETATAWIDILRIKEVLHNVISNALKYNQAGGFVEITVNPLDTRPVIRITVKDSGPGIEPDKIKHVFNEFETGGHISRHQKGTGLGMPISKKLMFTMGGDLTFETAPGQGTSFFIDLPLEKVLSNEMYRDRPLPTEDQAYEAPPRENGE